MLWRKERSHQGFTLLEIMISLAILSIALVSLLSATNKALQMNADSVALTDAVFLAREEMEKTFIDPVPEPQVFDKKISIDYPQYEWKKEIKETPFEEVYEVTLRVFHKGMSEKDGAKPVMSLKAYLMK